MPLKKVPYLTRNIKKKILKSTEFKSIIMVLSLDYLCEIDTGLSAV